MNIHLKFNNIIDKCLQDVSQSLQESNLQIEKTNKAVEELEVQLQGEQGKALFNLIKKHNQLLLENFFVISQQAKMLECYHMLIQSMNKRRVKRVESKTIIETEVIYNLLDYYGEHDSIENVELLKNYLKKVA